MSASVDNVLTNNYAAVLVQSPAGATPTVDANAAQNQRLVLSANAVVTLVAPLRGTRTMLVQVWQNGTGGFTCTFTGVTWPGGATPVFSTTANAKDLVALFWDGATWQGQFAQAFA